MAEPKYKVGQRVICARVFATLFCGYTREHGNYLNTIGEIQEFDSDDESYRIRYADSTVLWWPESSLDPAEGATELKVGDWVLVERVDREWHQWMIDLDEYKGKTLQIRRIWITCVSLWVDTEHNEFWNFHRDWLKPVPAPTKDQPMVIIITGLRTSQPIGAIRALRRATGGGVRENKDAVDQLRQPMPRPMRFKLESGLDLNKTLTSLRDEGFEVQAEEQVATPAAYPTLPAMLDAIRQEFDRLSTVTKQQEEAVRVAVEAERKRWETLIEVKDAELAARQAEISKLAMELERYRHVAKTGDSRMLCWRLIKRLRWAVNARFHA